MSLHAKLTAKNYREWATSLCRPCLLRLVDVLDVAARSGEDGFSFMACPECDPKIDAHAEITIGGPKS